ncbi:MAG: TlpA disulfide reductase family protein [Pyrinomonadaceae bacterium]
MTAATAATLMLFVASICLAQTGPTSAVVRDDPGSMPSSRPALSASSATALFETAVRNYNNGKFWEARTILEDLLALAPDHYLAHSLYWDTIERTVDTAGKRTAVRDSLAKLQAVPDERRSEEFFTAYIRAYNILGDTKQAAELTITAVSRFPRGEMAKRKLLEDVRQEADNEKAIAGYDRLLVDFAGDPPFAYQVVSAKFDRLARNRTFYDVAAMTAAAAQFDEVTKNYAVKFGNGALYLSSLRWITESLSYTERTESLRYGQLGIAQYQSLPDGARGAARPVYLQLFPPMMRAALALNDLEAARSAGALMVREFEAGAKAPPEMDEAAARKDYATALERLRQYNLARDQLAAAVVAAKSRGPYLTELRAFNSRHPLPSAEQTRFDRALSTKLSTTDQVRDDGVKAALLKTQINRAAPSFQLTDISGKPVSFGDYRGKVLVLGFWATWCGPCIREMEEMKIAFESHRGNPNIAFAIINLDADKTDIPQKARASGYKFPILLSDGKVEVAYRTERIPKLIIIDPQGNIRFDQTGYTSDGTYLKKLDWMIEAAQK